MVDGAGGVVIGVRVLVVTALAATDVDSGGCNGVNVDFISSAILAKVEETSSVVVEIDVDAGLPKRYSV